MTQFTEALENLDPNNFIDVDLDGDDFRNNWSERLSEWSSRPPFYMRDRFGVISVFCARREDIYELLLDKQDRFTILIPPHSGFEHYDLFMGLSNIAQTDGADHSRLHRLLAKPFSRASFNDFEPQIYSTVAEVLGEAEKKSNINGKFDAMNDLGPQLIAKIILERMLGFEEAQLNAFYAMGEALVLVQAIKPGDGFPQVYVEKFEHAKQVITQLVEKRRADPGNDFVSMMVHSRDGKDSLSEEELVGNIFAIAAAGLGTTAVSISMAIFNLCRHPDQLAALRENLSLIPAAVEECLRYQGPGFLGFPRFAVVDTTIGGVKVNKGMVVKYSPQGANYAAEKFAEPLAFDVFRKPVGITTFGSGPHTCIGNQIARAIMRIVLEDLLPRFPKLRLDDPNFKPHYHGLHGELAPLEIPLRVD